MGAYRQYRKTLYWHLLQCDNVHDLAYLAHFVCFAFSHFRIFRVFGYLVHFAIPHISHFTILHISHFTYSHISRVSHFRIFCISHFAFLHFLCFDTRYHAPPRIHCIPFTCPVLILRGQLVCISLCFTRITSCLYIPIYVHLSRYVFILHHPCTFSATYLAPSPGNSLSMLTCQRIVGGFWGDFLIIT